jgi:hypothetical protein
VKLLFILIASIGIPLTAHPQTTGPSADRTHVTMRLEKAALSSVFQRLINDYGVRIGFEESVLDREHDHHEFDPNLARDKELGISRDLVASTPVFKDNLITLDFVDATLAEVLDSVVVQMKHYGWRMDHGVVNIYPVRERDSRLARLLGVQVKEFAVGPENEVGDIQAQLVLFQPEFQEFLKQNGLQGSTKRQGSINEGRKLQKAIVFRNVTFLELLNGIAQEKGGGWILQIKKRQEVDQPDAEFLRLII